jgi:cardiolipin synthase
MTAHTYHHCILPVNERLMYKIPGNHYYLKRMDLHTTKVKADWDYTPANRRKTWQRLAARSGGLLTPGNILTWLGLGIVIFGLRQVSGGQLATGAIIIVVGRFLDVLDGLAADYTKTKSPLGEITDVVADKVAVFGCALVIVVRQLMPLYLIMALVVIYILISLLGAAVRIRQVELHPIRTGKLYTAFSWIGLLLYIFSDTARGISHQLLRTGAVIAIIITLALSLQSLYSYAKTVMESRHGKTKQ